METKKPSRSPNLAWPAGRRRQVTAKDDHCYRPSPDELEEDGRVDASPEELAQALFGNHLRRHIVH